MTPFDLTGKKAFVTGASRGIGQAIAVALAQAGADVALVARSEDGLAATAKQAAEAGREAFVIPADVTRQEAAEAAVAAAIDRLGHVDIVVNNAGEATSAPVAKLAPADWRRALDVIATGTFLCTREFLPGMLARRWGRVVQVASVAGLEGARYVAHYAAAKHAVVGFTRSLALEVAGTGVTANAVCPGYADTPMTEATLASVGRHLGSGRDEALAAVLASAHQSRLLSPEEIAAEVVRLCADAASNVNGESVRLLPGART